MKPQDEFLRATRHLAFYGLSRSGKGYATDIYRALHSYRPELHITAVHPEAEELPGVPMVCSAKGIMPPPDSAMIVLRASDAGQAVKDASSGGIQRAWLVMNAADNANRELARSLGVEIVEGCPLLFLTGQGFPHNLHRSLAQLFGKL